MQLPTHGLTARSSRPRARVVLEREERAHVVVAHRVEERALLGAVERRAVRERLVVAALGHVLLHVLVLVGRRRLLGGARLVGLVDRLVRVELPLDDRAVVAAGREHRRLADEAHAHAAVARVRRERAVADRRLDARVREHIERAVAVGRDAERRRARGRRVDRDDARRPAVLVRGRDPFVVVRERHALGEPRAVARLERRDGLVRLERVEEELEARGREREQPRLLREVERGHGGAALARALLAVRAARLVERDAAAARDADRLAVGRELDRARRRALGGAAVGALGRGRGDLADLGQVGELEQLDACRRRPTASVSPPALKPNDAALVRDRLRGAPSVRLEVPRADRAVGGACDELAARRRGAASRRRPAAPSMSGRPR